MESFRPGPAHWTPFLSLYESLEDTVSLLLYTNRKSRTAHYGLNLSTIQANILLRVFQSISLWNAPLWYLTYTGHLFLPFPTVAKSQMCWNQSNSHNQRGLGFSQDIQDDYCFPFFKKKVNPFYGRRNSVLYSSYCLIFYKQRCRSLLQEMCQSFILVICKSFAFLQNPPKYWTFPPLDLFHLPIYHMMLFPIARGLAELSAVRVSGACENEEAANRPSWMLSAEKSQGLPCVLPLRRWASKSCWDSDGFRSWVLD